MTAPNPVLDPWFAKAGRWQAEVSALRQILLGCELAEVMKWGKPTYTAGGANIVLIMPMKDTCALLFMKGALVDDPQGLLVQPGENSQSARQLRFTSAAEITERTGAVQELVRAAVRIEQAGLKVAFRKSSDLVWPKEFQDRLDQDPALRAAFGRLTPGRQRQYHLHFTGARLPATRASRVDKAIPRILDGMGLDD